MLERHQKALFLTCREGCGRDSPPNNELRGKMYFSVRLMWQTDECKPHTHTWGSTRHLNVTQMHLHMVCVQGVWSMEGQQPGSGEAGRRRRQRRPVSAPRPRIPAHRPPAGEAPNPADYHRKPDQEIRNSPPPLRHSGRYGRARRVSNPLSLMCSGLSRTGLRFCYEGKTVLMDIFGPVTTSSFWSKS